MVFGAGFSFRENGGDYSKRGDKMQFEKGYRFGMLETISESGRVRHGKASSPRWICSCACGNIKPFSSANLLNDVTKTCGCARHRRIKPGQKFLAVFGDNYCTAEIRPASIPGRFWAFCADTGSWLGEYNRNGYPTDPDSLWLVREARQ